MRNGENANNLIYKSLSDRTKCFIAEIGQDKDSMYNMIQQLEELLSGNITEDDFLKVFYGQYRPSKCRYMSED
jgi:hypothetical protein